MSQEALLIYKKLGLIEEATFPKSLPPTATTKLCPLRENGIVIGIGANNIIPKVISGRASVKRAILGTVSPKFTVPTFFHPTGIPAKLLKWAMGQETPTEVASFTVTLNVNDTLDMTEDGGGAFAITLTPGVYLPGATSADAGTLCALLKTLIEAGNGAATYTVTYSQTTHKFTITKNSGVFVIKFATGTNTAKNAASLLGFSVADTASAIAATSDSTVNSVWDHVMKPLDAITYGLSAGITAQVALANGKVYDITDNVLDTLKIAYKPNEELHIDAMFEGRLFQNSADNLSALTEETSSPLLYSQLAFTAGGVTCSLADLEIDFSNNFKKDLRVNSQYRSRFPRNGFRDVKAKFTLDLADSKAYTIYDAFMADTQPVLQAVWTGAASSIKTGFAYTLTADMPKAKYELADIPGGGGQAAPNAPINVALLDDGTNGELKLTLRNNEASL